MNYGEIFSRAWQIIWKHKVLWIFGIMAGCASGGGGGGSGGSSNFSNSSSGAGANPFPSIERFFESLSETQIILIVAAVFLFVLLLVIVAIFVGTVGRIGLIRGASQADRDENAALSFGALFRGSLSYFWRVFLLGLLVGLAVTAVIFALVLVGMAGAVLTLGLALICLIPLICLLVPVMWAVTVIMEQAAIAIVVEDLGILASLQRGWEIVRANPGPMAIMFLVLTLGVKGVGGLIIALPAIVTMMPFVFGMLGGQDSLVPGLVISLVCFTAYLPFLLVMNGILQSYVGSAWTLTFLRLSGPAALAPEPVLAPAPVQTQNLASPTAAQ